MTGCWKFWRVHYSASSKVFTITACKISGLESAYIHACKQYILWSCNKSTFNTVHFHKNPSTCSLKRDKKKKKKKREKKASMVSNLALVLGFFPEWLCNKHSSERVNVICKQNGMWKNDTQGHECDRSHSCVIFFCRSMRADLHKPM